MSWSTRLYWAKACSSLADALKSLMGYDIYTSTIGLVETNHSNISTTFHTSLNPATRLIGSKTPQKSFPAPNAHIAYTNKITIKFKGKAIQQVTHRRRWARDSCSCPSAVWGRDGHWRVARRGSGRARGRPVGGRRSRSTGWPRCRVGTSGPRSPRPAPSGETRRRSPLSRTCGTAIASDSRCFMQWWIPFFKVDDFLYIQIVIFVDPMFESPE